MRTIEQIRAAMLKKGYVFFEKGDYNLNLIAVRENDIFENTFSDTFYCIFKKAGVWQTIEMEWTTLAGTLGHGGEKNPLTGAETGTGVDGVAIIIPNQYRGVYKFVDTYIGFLSYPYFMQVKNMDYWRDNDRNGLITKGKVYTGNYATLLHRMTNNNVNSKQVNSQYVAWSQGCNGAPEPQFRKLLRPVREAIKLYGNSFTYTILEAKDL